jgi:hypothetical protein
MRASVSAFFAFNADARRMPKHVRGVCAFALIPDANEVRLVKKMRTCAARFAGATPKVVYAARAL